MPFINVVFSAMYIIIPWALDTRFTFDRFYTKQTSLNSYKQVYMGYDFELHVKYTNAMVMMFTAMMYGLSMPIMFPITAIFMYTYWLCERIQVVWIYKLPPKLNNKLTTDVLRILKLAPLFLLFNSFWILDN